jgi:trigger factor
MNISRENIDDLNARISINIEEDDYKNKVEEVLKDYRKKASIKGFRPGKVPMGMIRKMYFKPVLVDEINRMVSEKLMSYIRDEKISILGEPLPSKEDQTPPDFDNQKEFDFKFDIGLSPEVDPEISEKDKIPYYTIKVEDTTIDEQVDEVAKRFGDFIPVEEVTGNELNKAEVSELDAEGNALEEGLSVEEAKMSVEMIKDEEIKKLFKGKKAGDKVSFDISKAYPNEAELSSLLNIDKEKLAELSSMFEATIKEVLKFEKHEVNQELFDKVYGEGQIKSEEEFRDKVKEELSLNYERESNYKFAMDFRDHILKKYKFELPSDFLKRWLTETNENMTAEKVEEEFNNYEDEFRWQLIKDKLGRKYEIFVSDEELLEYATILARNQFYQYGLYNMPDEHIMNYAREQMEKPEEKRRLREQKMEDKIYSLAKEKVKMDNKDTSLDKFRKLLEK